MLNHFNTCVLIDGETFYCNRCAYGPDTRTIIEEHIKANHSLGVIEAIVDNDFSDSDEDAEVGEESSESEGESGDDESLERDDEYDDDDDGFDDDDGWNTKGYKKKRLRDWAHNEVMLNSCLDRKGNQKNHTNYILDIPINNISLYLVVVLAEHALLLKSFSSGTYFQPTIEWTQDLYAKTN